MIGEGRTLGILGGGQLAQMLALAALPLGVRVVVLEPDAQAPARLCADPRRPTARARAR